MKTPSGIRIDDGAWPLVVTHISYIGVTSGNGNAGGTSLVCADLVNHAPYVDHYVKLLDGGAAGQIQPIAISALGTLTFLDPFTNATGVAQQIVAGTRFVIMSAKSASGGGGGGGGSAVGGLKELDEHWKLEVGISELRWSVTNPLTGTPWAVSTLNSQLMANSIPALNETTRLVSVQRYFAGPGIYGINRIARKLSVEWEMRLANVANIDNALSFFGLSTGLADIRTTQNMIAFSLLADVLQTITDNGGAETVTTAFGETLTNVNKFKIEINPGSVDFSLNGAVIATHAANLPNGPMYLHFYVDTEAGGTGTIELGWIQAGYDIIVI